MITDNPVYTPLKPGTYNERPVFPKYTKFNRHIISIKDWKIYNDDGRIRIPQGTVIMIDDEARTSYRFLRDFYDWLWTGEIEAKIYEAWS